MPVGNPHFNFQAGDRDSRLRLLVDPVLLSALPAENLALLEPQSDFLLGALNGVRAVADVTADINGVVTADGARGRGEGVGGTEKNTTGLDGITALPDHGADGTAVHVVDEASEEGLVLEVGIVLLEVLLAGGDELDGSKLVAAVLEAGDDGANESTLDAVGLDSNEGLLGGRHAGNWDLIDCGVGGRRDLIVIKEEMGAEEEEAKQ